MNIGYMTAVQHRALVNTPWPKKPVPVPSDEDLERAAREGYHASLKGSNYCPYGENDPLFDAWCEGWLRLVEVA